jgi:hypothetical protein
VAWDQLPFSARHLFMPIIPRRFYQIFSSYKCRCIFGRAPSGLRRQIPTSAEIAGVIVFTSKIRFLEKESAYHQALRICPFRGEMEILLTIFVLLPQTAVAKDAIQAVGGEP